MDRSLLLDVSRETSLRLSTFAAALTKWNARINLVSANDIEHLWSRHIADCLQLSALASGVGSRWVDIGSGGGLPGVVLAILHSETRPAACHVLIESDRRKAAFLSSTCHDLGLDVEVIPERAENVRPLSADVVTARAVAPLDRLLCLVHRHLAATGQAILPKGRNTQREIDDAAVLWRFSHHRVVSQSAADASIIVLRDLTHA